MTTLRLEMNANLFLKDPQDTDLGKKIISQSIQMIDTLGLESFTFKKLSGEIGSTEASIYRYFENKHKLLIYLISWYWSWLEYRIEFETNNVPSPQDRLSIALRLITEKKELDTYFPAVDEIALQRIVISEFDKIYLTKQVDHDNKDGLFLGFKSLCRSLTRLIIEINPTYKFPKALISTVMQASHQQIFFSEHLPSLTEHQFGKSDIYRDNNQFISELINQAIRE